MKRLLSISSILFIISCGGGGGGGGSTPTPTTPTPTVNLSADPVSVLLQNTSTLTWSSTNATSCSASWTNQTGSSGSEAVTILTAGNNSFSITCTGAGGSRSATVTVEGYRNTDGVVVDGYISGAEVCIDEDESWTCDSSENSTTSDNEGKFTIRYANGNLVSIGGTDLDSQTLLDNLLITHKLTGHSDFKAVTPVTSVAAFMEDASLVNAALGIDVSIDVFTFDPVANKGDGGINDYLYEKGNQLTVLAFALQNITNNLNTTTETTQDYFKAITEEIEKEYTETETKVDIETETFVTKAFENVIAAKSVTIDETAKVNTTKALASILPVIEVKSSDDLTTGVIRFAVSTLQTDIQAIANGTATAETVTSYTSDVLAYIAEDQNIDADEIAPDITAIADSASTSEDTAVEINVLLNDSYLTSSSISITAGNGTNGTTSVASNNIVTYDPDADFNGTDIFSYTITQGNETSSADVTVTIEAVNDAPSIDVASTIQVQENQTAVTTVSVSDVDEDELTLTLGGTDADSFNLSDENVLTFKEKPDYETKTSYSITLSLTDGTETVTKDINLDIQDIGEFYGSAIDGYISGANIFIDQNFNFFKDEGELSAITDSDGKFEVLTEDLSLYECLKNRPIVADVPVGAVDSTLGEVTKAYQMILPSLNDSGPEKVVVSPFSSLFSEQITNAIADLKLENELTITEGCQSIGDNIASNISIKIQELKSILDSLGVTYDELTDNFISSPNGIISETTAQNIAEFLPSITSIKLILKTEMTNNFGFEINPSLIIGQDTINVIFDPNRIENIIDVPVTLFTTFSSETNSSGWYKQSTITANGSKLDSVGNLIPYKCYSTNSQDCLEKNVTLDVLANYSKDYRNSVGWFRPVNKSNPISIGLVVNGSIEVSSSDVRYYDDSIENTLHSCGVEEIIQLTGSKVNEIGHAYQYQTNYNEGTGLQNGCNISSDSRRASIEIRKFGTDVNGNEESLSTSYVTNNIDTSNLFSSKPVNLFNDFENVDPLGIINEIANLEFNFSKFSSIRSSLASGERVEFRYSLRHSNGQFSKQYVLTLGQVSANDAFSMETYDENGIITSTNNIAGISALESYSNKILDEAPNSSSIINNKYYSNESPVITSTNTFSTVENQTAIGTVAATDADGDTITYSISGSDITINSSSGVIAFASAPDYETKAVYTATVTASDGINSSSQIIEILVSNICEFDFIFYENSTIESRGEDWSSNYRYRENLSSHSRYVRKFSANSPGDTACPQPEIFDFKIEGPDADFFELSSLEGNDYDRYYIYSTKDFDYENPLDADANNIYEYHLVGEYGGEIVKEVLTLEIKNENEYGNIESISFDQSNENIQIIFTTNHDLPTNTAYIEFGVRGPSAPLRFLSGKIPYDSSQSNYNIEFSYGNQLGTDNISPELWGGYYQINKITFYDQNEDEIKSIFASRISGDVTTYVTVDSGKNFVKVKSLSGELTVEDENGVEGTRFTGLMEFENYGWVDSNSSRAAGTAFYPSLMLMAGSAPKGLNDYSGSWTFGNESNTDNGDGTFTSTINSTDLDFYTRSGKHEYRLRIRQRGYNGSNYYIYLYPQELLKFGYVDSYTTFVNNKATSEDLTGPALTYYSNLEVESCTFDNSKVYADIAMDVGYSQSTTSNPRADLTLGSSNDLYYMYSRGVQYNNGQTLRDEIQTEFTGKTREDFEVELYAVAAYDKALNYNRLEKNSNYHKAPEVRKVNLLDHCDERIITNNAPVITSDAIFTAAENQRSVGSVTVDDVDGDDITYTIAHNYSEMEVEHRQD